ncbi:hypothetical protein THF1C08_370060 [Vibrio jasicida]|uniref:Uncharacterized protein n=1 Tax=Vibrio jasicida TaxID=766224 RepID=A0AAU9QSM9_9VIBR|nr:hypothetical protein THF1C08_370060 [Vibrio jasicida]CAH1598708.1 hypothetical protein THF1A12_370060 [Vibrio jasicida]
MELKLRYNITLIQLTDSYCLVIRVTEQTREEFKVPQSIHIKRAETNLCPFTYA